jgi:hypothetical protein
LFEAMSFETTGAGFMKNNGKVLGRAKYWQIRNGIDFHQCYSKRCQLSDIERFGLVGNEIRRSFDKGDVQIGTVSMMEIAGETG